MWSSLCPVAGQSVLEIVFPSDTRTSNDFSLCVRKTKFSLLIPKFSARPSAQPMTLDMGLGYQPDQPLQYHPHPQTLPPVPLLMLVSTLFAQLTAPISIPARKPGIEKKNNKYILKKQKKGRMKKERT